MQPWLVKYNLALQMSTTLIVKRNCIVKITDFKSSAGADFATQIKHCINKSNQKNDHSKQRKIFFKLP